MFAWLKGSEVEPLLSLSEDGQVDDSNRDITEESYSNLPSLSEDGQVDASNRDITEESYSNQPNVSNQEPKSELLLEDHEHLRERLTKEFWTDAKIHIAVLFALFWLLPCAFVLIFAQRSWILWVDSCDRRFQTSSTVINVGNASYEYVLEQQGSTGCNEFEEHVNQLRHINFWTVLPIIWRFDIYFLQGFLVCVIFGAGILAYTAYYVLRSRKQHALLQALLAHSFNNTELPDLEIAENGNSDFPVLYARQEVPQQDALHFFADEPLQNTSTEPKQQNSLIAGILQSLEFHPRLQRNDGYSILNAIPTPSHPGEPSGNDTSCQGLPAIASCTTPLVCISQVDGSASSNASS